MKKSILPVLLLILNVILICSCGNTVEEEGQSECLNDLKVECQSFVINSKKGGLIKTVGDLEIVIPSSAFKTSCDSVRVSVREFQNVSDMVLENLYTISNDKILETGGMFYIEVFADGNPVELQENAVLKVRDEDIDKIGGMKIFYSNSEMGGSDWVEDTTFGNFAILPTSVGDTLVFTPFLEDGFLSFSKLGWVNLDKFIDEGNQVDLIVSLDELGGNDLVGCLIFDSFSSIVPGERQSNNKFLFKKIPEGEDACFVMIGEKNKKPFVSITDLNTSSLVIEATVSGDITVDELRTTLNNKFR